MPKRSLEYMQQQRMRILEAAKICFRHKGVTATSLSNICEAAGLSTGALYKHFASRDELLHAFLHLCLEQRSTALYGATWSELRENTLRFHDDSGHHTFWGEFVAFADLNKRMKEMRAHRTSCILTQIEKQLRIFIETGEIQPTLSPDRTARFIVTIFDGSLIELKRGERLDASPCNLGAYLDHVVGASRTLHGSV